MVVNNFYITTYTLLFISLYLRMFIREKKTPNSSKTAIQLVENIRQGNRVVQKVIRHFGYALNEEEIKALKKIALRYKYDIEHQDELDLFNREAELNILDKSLESLGKEEDLPVNLLDLKEEKRFTAGLHYCYKQLYDSIGFNGLLTSANSSRTELSQRLFHLVLARITKPSSKRSSVSLVEQEYGVHIDLNGVYRMMDALNDSKIDTIKELSYHYINSLFSEKINVIFYDCTTLYFESFEQDELKSNGYSKDNKFNQAQVLLSIMVTESGLPIGYELYEGNKFEGHTLINALERIHEKYEVNRVVLVADAGLLSKANIELLRAYNQSFIVGARIKNLSDDLTRQILDKSLYQTINHASEDEPLLYQDILLNENLRLIVTYSEQRAQKDQHDRQKAIESLQKRLLKSKELKTIINNYGYKKFLKIEGESRLTINEEKVTQAQAWDGLHGIITNIPSNAATVKEILHQYKGLWQVEETFRISKHDLRMRPIFHWKPRRIKAHIAICYMALVCVRLMEYKVALQYKKMSPASIHRELQKLQLSILKDYKTGNNYALPSKATQDSKKIMQLFGKKWSDTPYMIT